MTGETLRDRLRGEREHMEGAHATRLHRAVSWLRCAEQYADADEDLAFIALWIAFNSCYAIDDERKAHSFRDEFQQYADRLVSFDQDDRIYNCLWFNFSQFIRTLVDNQWVFSPFWRSHRQGDDEWKASFELAKRRAYRALADNEVAVLLSIVMDRLYVLRNQLVHGGSTWQSSVNRDQVRDGKRVLFELVPIFIEIMIEHQDGWGEIYYPVIDTRAPKDS